MWRVYLLSALIACVAGAATAFVTVQFMRSWTVSSSPTTLVLEGEEDLASDHEKVVYYKTPFASPPYLTATGIENYKIVDQQAGSFKLQRPSAYYPGVKLKWKAEGQPAK
jgi:hypothetical protein